MAWQVRLQRLPTVRLRRVLLCASTAALLRSMACRRAVWGSSPFIETSSAALCQLRTSPSRFLRRSRSIAAFDEGVLALG